MKENERAKKPLKRLWIAAGIAVAGGAIALAVIFVPATFSTTVTLPARIGDSDPGSPARQVRLIGLACYSKGDASVSSADFDRYKLPKGMPVSNKDARVSLAFGLQDDPFKPGEKTIHLGVDIVVPSGSTVFSTMEGTVLESGSDPVLGHYIVVGKDEVSTLYAQLLSQGLAKGAAVKVGDAIGTSGSSGRSTGPHLHYEVRVGERFVDPIPFLYLAIEI